LSNTIAVSLSDEIQAALASKQPIVALESTVISHGLPYPENLTLAQELEDLVRGQGAVPATIAIIEGQPKAGLSADEMERLADGKTEVLKISRRDFGSAIARRCYGATTVAATMIVAHQVGIQVFATGGIGGVHHGTDNDVSADLPELSQTPVAVVCAGAKSILDLPRTLEWLETFGVPVLGYGTTEFPAFYTRRSGLTLTDSVDSASEAARVIASQWNFGLTSGVLVTVPIPEADALEPTYVDGLIQRALAAADAQGVKGKEITPFLLSYLVEISDGETLQANLSLLRNNAKIAAQIAVALTGLTN
jgi:pseudouridine-5'-phosphate glycosidase